MRVIEFFSKLEREMNVKVLVRELTEDPRCKPSSCGTAGAHSGGIETADCRSGAPRAYTLGPERW